MATQEDPQGGDFTLLERDARGWIRQTRHNIPSIAFTELVAPLVTYINDHSLLKTDGHIQKEERRLAKDIRRRGWKAIGVLLMDESVVVGYAFAYKEKRRPNRVVLGELAIKPERRGEEENGRIIAHWLLEQFDPLAPADFGPDFIKNIEQHEATTRPGGAMAIITGPEPSEVSAHPAQTVGQLLNRLIIEG